MSRKAKRLRSRNRFLELRVKVLTMLAAKLTTKLEEADDESEQLKRELARWKPTVTIENMPALDATRLAILIDGRTVEYSHLDLDSIVQLTCEEAGKKLREHFTRRGTV